jgi:hypothetical protein
VEKAVPTAPAKAVSFPGELPEKFGQDRLGTTIAISVDP